jgi:hypothetical protein
MAMTDPDNSEPPDRTLPSAAAALAPEETPHPPRSARCRPVRIGTPPAGCFDTRGRIGLHRERWHAQAAFEHYGIPSRRLVAIVLGVVALLTKPVLGGAQL